MWFPCESQHRKRAAPPPPDSWFADSPHLHLKLCGESVVIDRVNVEASFLLQQAKDRQKEQHESNKKGKLPTALIKK